MTKLHTQQYGLGIEMEGFIVNGSRGQERINNQSSAEWVMQQFSKKHPQLTDKISLEEASVMLEVKTDVHQNEQEATDQILTIRHLVDQLLAEHGCKLIFQPVLEQPFDFVPASSDPNSRAHQLIKEWSGTPEGLRMLNSTAIASLQINDSRPFQTTPTDQEKFELARKVHNLYSQNFAELNSHNVPKRNNEGKTRLEILFHLMTNVKKEQFANHGFSNPISALIPPYFADVDALKKWMLAHSKFASSFEKAQCKNEHAATIKIKRDPYWAIETRVFDATDTRDEINRVLQFNHDFLKPFLPTNEL